MGTYTTITSPSGFEIKFALRMKSFLVMNTNFNPLVCIDLGEAHFNSIPGISHMESVGTYDDGTGYFIFRLNHFVIHETLLVGISEVFQNYFDEI